MYCDMPMKTIDDIQIMIYQKSEEKIPLVKDLLSLKGKEIISFTDEIELGTILRFIQDKGVPSKEVLVLKPFKGRLFQKCPGSPGMICCNYLLINTCFNCLYNCAYCFLLSYLNSYGVIQFTNTEDIISELNALIDPNRELVYRIGTGEFTDSLMFDEYTGLAHKIIHALKDYANVMVEFKTKSENVDHLLAIREKGNSVLAWSLNTEKNIELYEEDTAGIDARLRAAQKAGEAGYYLAFHFDPIIQYEGYMSDYEDVIGRLFSMVPRDRVVWISLGGFRYSPGFKEIIKERFPGERMTLGELFQGPDGKFRYIKNQRINIYKRFKEMISAHTSKPFLYLCMETSDVWRQAFGEEYNSSNDMENAFSRHLYKHFLS